MTRALSTPPVVCSEVISGSQQPVLSAARDLELRPWAAADAPVFLGAYQDEQIRRWHTRRPQSEAQVRQWFDDYRQDWQSATGAHWAIARSDGEVLGRISTRSWNFDDGIAGVGYWVLPAARDAGVATCAVMALSAWALDEIGFYRLYLDHSTRNHASCRVATKSGYLLEGTMRSAAVHDDGRHDMHLHARIRDA
jgi:RimJ/RimL family protein N-acetyltransferase